MIVWLGVVTGLALWLLWDEIHDARPDPDVPVTIVGETDPWDEYVLSLPPGAVIVGPDGIEYEVTEQWPADAIVAVLADLNQLPEVAA